MLITGSSGFLGSHIHRTLLEKSDEGLIALLRLFDISDHDPPNSPVSGLYPEIRTERQQGNVRSYDAVKKACRGMDVVLHTAAVVDLGDKPPGLLEDVNVKGTENVVRACKEEGVRCLVYTSSVDAVITGRAGTELEVLTEYPPESELLFGTYGMTKQRAEKEVLRSNGDQTGSGDGKLVTCALRPTVMYGEGDPFNVSKSLGMAIYGVIVRVKDASNQFQNVYAGNVAWAHLCAMKAAMKDPVTVGGQAYFVTDDTPAVPYFDFLQPFTARLGYKYSSIGVPCWLLFSLAYILEWIAWLISPIIRMNLVLRTASVTVATTTLTYSRKKAEEQLDYQPLYSHEEAIERSIPYYRKILHGK